MPKPCSLDLRMRLLEAVIAGASRREAADCFDVSASSAVKWRNSGRKLEVSRQADRGEHSPLEEHADWLLALISKQSDLTLDEVVAAMRKRRIAGSRSAVWRFFKRHNISFKKKPAGGGAGASRRGPRGGAGCENRACLTRPGWCLSTRPRLTPPWCGFRPLLARRALIGRVPQGHWETITFVAGLRHDKMVAPFVVDGPMTRATFLAYLEQCLRPTLKRGDIVIIDTSGPQRCCCGEGHQNCACAAALSAEILTRSQSNRAGLQQIENASAQGCRANIPGLCRRIGKLIAAFSARECTNYFSHAGYVSK